MRLKLIVSFLLLILSSHLKSQVVYKNKSASTDARVKDLVKRMTLEEKVLQLNQYIAGLNNNVNNIGESIKEIPAGIGSLILFSPDPEFRNQIQKKAIEESRLGIPILFGFDVIHGFRTIYPIPLAQASSWNPELIQSAAAIAAKEAKLSGTDWTFSPMIDVAYDARWGRVAEGYGEDPYTNAIFGVATIKGYQGNKLSDPFSIAACLKHFVGYSRSEGGRDYRYSDVSPQSLWETYLPPYEAGVKAGAATLMSGFNDISGIPATANHYLLSEVLKEKWGHKGFVVSDWEAVKQLINQGVAKDEKEAALKAFNAGLEMDMKDDVYRKYLPELISEKKIDINKINDAVSRVLKVKFDLGLFDEPYVKIINPSDRYLQPNSLAIAEKAAAESMVLLKNNNSILPLQNQYKKIAIIGPIAKDSLNILGSWTAHGKVTDSQSFYTAISSEFKGIATVTYAKGSGFEGTNKEGFKEAINKAQEADVILLCLGEMKAWSGENATRSTIALPLIQEELMKELKELGKPIVLILSNGRPLELMRIEPMADAILEAWQPGTSGAKALAQILSGKVNPSGKLPITFPLTTGQIPIYYNMRQSARPMDKMGDYQDISTQPLYSFGFGLSYSKFEYNDIKISSKSITNRDKIIAEVSVKNTGVMDGMETVHWFISDPVATISRPLKELKFFEKKLIRAGETVTYKFEIDPEKDLSYRNSEGNIILEEGDFYLIVNKQKIRFEVVR